MVFRIIIFCSSQWLAIALTEAQSTRSPGLHVQVLDHKQIDSILDMNENHLVFFWGTWCKPCYESLDSLMNMDLRPKKIKILLVAESHSSKKILDEISNKYGLSEYDNIISGILNSKDYTNKYIKNIRIFNWFICNKCVEESGTDLRFSAVFIFDNNRNLLYYNKKLLDNEYNSIRNLLNSFLVCDVHMTDMIMGYSIQ